MIRFTGIVIVNNEVEFVAPCLASIKPIADEILVIHDGPCVDGSLEVARSFTDQVFERPRQGAMEPHLVEALERAANDWIVKLDCDEHLSRELQQAIADLDVKNGAATHYAAAWREWRAGQPSSLSRVHEKTVVFDRRHCVCVGIPHRGLSVKGVSGRLPGYLEHTPRHVEYGLIDLIRRKMYPFSRTDAKLRYGQVRVYPRDACAAVPKRDVWRSRLPILSMPLFVFNAYLKSLVWILRATSWREARRQLAMSHAHLFYQFALSVFMRLEKSRVSRSR